MFTRALKFFQIPSEFPVASVHFSVPPRLGNPWTVERCVFSDMTCLIEAYVLSFEDNIVSLMVEYGWKSACQKLSDMPIPRRAHTVAWHDTLFLCNDAYSFEYIVESSDSYHLVRVEGRYFLWPLNVNLCQLIFEVLSN